MQNSKEVKDQELNKVEGGFLSFGVNPYKKEARCLEWGKTFTYMGDFVAEYICPDCKKKNLAYEERCPKWINKKNLI